VISRREDLQKFLDGHPLHRIYGGENALLLREYVAALRAAGLRVDTVLGPFDSEINFAPQTRETLRREIARRAGLRGRGMQFVAEALGRPAIWRFVRGALRMIDRRPGRLYSFVCALP
jgi:hypothetical protein